MIVDSPEVWLNRSITPSEWANLAGRLVGGEETKTFNPEPDPDGIQAQSTEASRQIGQVRDQAARQGCRTEGQCPGGERQAESPARWTVMATSNPATNAPCPACGKSHADYLTLAESIDVAGYGKTTCTTCLLTEIPRPKPKAKADSRPPLTYKDLAPALDADGNKIPGMVSVRATDDQ